MMNRGVMQRQMFAGGGAAYPMQQPVYMANGGPPPMMPPEGIMSAAPPGMPPPSPEMMANQGAQMMDPQALEGVLGNAQASGYGDPEAAGSFEEMMNSVSGEAKSPEERRTDLASIVGPEDADQTPDSVLALVTPIVQIALVDQGIGPMAQEQMNTPVEGDMGQGIMTMAANGNMGVGNEPPVNFNLGGEVRRRGDQDPVQYFQQAGVVMGPSDILALNDASSKYNPNLNLNLNTSSDLNEMQPSSNRLRDLFEQKKGVYSGILGDSDEQKKMTQAQILFDIANTALTFAAPMEGEKSGLTMAQRLAMAATKTKLAPTIAARAADLTAQKQKLDLAALQAAETSLTAETKAQSDLATASAKVTEKPDYKGVIITDKDGKRIGTLNAKNPSHLTLIEDFAKLGYNMQYVSTESDKSNILNYEGYIVKDKTGKTIKILNAKDEAQNKELTGKYSNGELYSISKVPTESTSEEKEKKQGTRQLLTLRKPVKGRLKIWVDSVDDKKLIDEQSKNDNVVSIENAKSVSDGTTNNFLLGNGKVVALTRKNDQWYDLQGKIIDIASDEYTINGQGPIFMSDEQAYQHAQERTRQSLVAEALNKAYEEEGLSDLTQTITQGTKPLTSDIIVNGETVAKKGERLFAGNSNYAKPVFDLLKSSQEGVGFFPKLAQIIGETTGALNIPVLKGIFSDARTAKTEIEAANILLRMALSSSPRLAEGEQIRLAKLIPNADSFLADPDTAIKRYVLLKRILKEDYINNLENQYGEKDPVLSRQYRKENYAISSALKFLDTIPDKGFVETEEFNKALDVIRQKQK